MKRLQNTTHALKVDNATMINNKRQDAWNVTGWSPCSWARS